MPEFVDLDRQFIRWDSGSESDPEIYNSFEGLGTSLIWPDLLKCQRVVILAEAGSGKSAELSRRAEMLNAEEKAVFILTLQNIGRKGFERALGKSQLSRFETWKKIDTPGWMFLDSVDEAKRADFSFSEILDEVAEAIADVGRRIHLVISGRYSDWEFKRDLKTLLKKVPIPPVDLPPSTVSPNEALIAALQNEKPKEVAKIEEPLIVIMAPLDRERMKTFAQSKGITNVDTMLAKLENQNLWSFARRPVDLDWLVNYWRLHDAFGSLADMLDQSLIERLKETNSSRTRDDVLNPELSIRAMERIGASLVLQRLDTLLVPDTTLDLSEGVPALALESVLPDWSLADRAKLISRPIFDPASAGFVRLHNDNQGAVRGYLAARWIHRLRTLGNCPWSRIFDLLFAETYSIKLVKPSLRATAAWLSLWDRETAQVVIDRDPRLLMDAGDPGSLPFETRTAALTAMISSIKNHERFEVPDHDSLRRFAKQDLSPFISEQWSKNKGFASVRMLLMLLIWLGEIKECADIAIQGIYGDYDDRYTKVFGGRAIATIGSPEEKRQYIQFIVKNVATIPAVVIWDALDLLFPSYISIAEMLALINGVPQKDEGGLGLDYYGPRLANRLTTASETIEFIDNMLSRLSVKSLGDDRRVAAKDERILETLEVAAIKLLEITPDNQLPEQTISVALRLGESRRHSTRHRSEKNLGDLIKMTASRRRIALWAAVKVLRENKIVDVPIVDPWQLQFLGYQPGLSSVDLDWLLEDVSNQQEPDNIRFAMNTALSIWKQDGEIADKLPAIKSAATTDISLSVLRQWFTPHVPTDDEERFNRQRQERLQKTAIEQAKAEASWIDFAEKLRANPNQLREIPPPSEKGTIDSRLFHLWKLLSGLGNNRSHHAIRDLSPLQPLFGQAVIDALRYALVTYWRHLRPKLGFERSPAERNLIRSADLIGIVGVTQEALISPDWTTKLSADDVRLATRLAIFELNGFPDWLDDLATQFPIEVGEILWANSTGELHPIDTEPHSYFLAKLASSGEPVVSTIADPMLTHLETHTEIPIGVAEAGLRIVLRGSAMKERIIELAISRFESSENRHLRAVYLAPVFEEDPERATNVLIKALESLSEPEQVALVQAVLPKVFGGRFSRGEESSIRLPFAILEQLVLLSFKKIHPDADKDHLSGEVYTPDERDDAEVARSNLFRQLINTPGLATFTAMERLIANNDFPVNKDRMAEIMRDRAANDSESEAWRSQDVRTFEIDFESVPATSKDLQRVGISRLDDIQHQLIEGDFNQGLVVARLPREVDVQNWFGEALRSRQGRSYSLEREPHVAEEKEPDIRLQSKIADARCPIEIKVAETWTLKQLEEAITLQLRDRYLRDRDNRFGILLVIHQKARPTGWQLGESWLPYNLVISHLQKISHDLGAADALAPQIVVCSIDVSKVKKPPKKRRRNVSAQIGKVKKGAVR